MCAKSVFKLLYEVKVGFERHKCCNFTRLVAADSSCATCAMDEVGHVLRTVKVDYVPRLQTK